VTVEEGLRSQVRNIEAKYGRSMDEWAQLIHATGKRRHGEIVAWLKSEHELPHGAANRIALVVLDSANEQPGQVAPRDQLYSGSKAALLPIHDRLMQAINRFGGDIELAPKKGYVSLRRRKQFAMIKPAARHVDLGLILPATPVTDRLESAATFNALFTHRVRVQSTSDVDAELEGWLRKAYDAAG